MRFLAAPLAALLALFGISTAPPDGTPVRVVVLHTNDLHGQCLPRDAPGRKDAKIGGFAAIQAAVEREREAAKASGAHVVLVDAGDWYQGTPEGNLAKDGAPGALVVDWMGRVRYDAVAIGNHEFDFGVANVEKLLARARFPVLGANIVRPAPNAANGEKSATTVPFAKPYAVVERGGVRLAFVGLCSSETPRMTVAGRTGDLVFEDDTESARRWFDRARKEADLVFLLTHCGKEVDERLARRVPECPVIFGGHSHTRLEKAIVVDHEASAMSSNPWADGVPPRTYVVQSGAKAENLDRVALEIDPATKRIAKVDARLVPLLLEDVGEDAATKRWLAEETAPVATEMAKVLATVVPPERPAPKGRQTDPTHNLVCDAMLDGVRKVDHGVVAAFGNATGVRTKVETGPFSLRNAYEIVPFDNTVVVMTLGGRDLVDLLGEGVSGDRPRLIAAGIEGSVAPRADGTVDASDVRIGGEPIRPESRYRVAANSFIATGKGGLGAFERGVDRNDTGLLVRDLLGDYVAAKGKLALDDELRLRVKRDGATASRREGAAASREGSAASREGSAARPATAPAH